MNERYHSPEGKRGEENRRSVGLLLLIDRDLSCMKSLNSTCVTHTHTHTRPHAHTHTRTHTHTHTLFLSLLSHKDTHTQSASLSFERVDFERCVWRSPGRLI